jgi:polysaccharide biosynthesis/export protein
MGRRRGICWHPPRRLAVFPDPPFPIELTDLYTAEQELAPAAVRHLVITLSAGRMRILLSLVLAGLVIPVGLPLSAQSSATRELPQTSGVPVFQPGDVIRVTVWRNPELSGQFDIAEDGTIIHPLYRSVRAGGVAVSEVEAGIRGVLQRFEANPEMVVEPLFRVSIGGEVRTPNVYTLSPATTVGQAITQAGGPTLRADVKHARLMREGTEIAVDLTRPAHELSHLRIRSGDQIILDPKRNLWVDTLRPGIGIVGSLVSIWYAFSRVRN